MGLSFTPILKSEPVLIPGNNHALQLIFENDTEYDKQLFCTLCSPDGLCLSKNHFDVLVPAEGRSIEEIAITIPENLRIFYESYFFVLETTDAVLEEDKHFAFFLKCALPWKYTTQSDTEENKIYMSGSHIFSCNSVKFSPSQTLVTYLACSYDASVDILLNSTEKISIFLNSTFLGCFKGIKQLTLNLIHGINTICIQSNENITSLTAEFIQNNDYIPACINPDYIKPGRTEI